MEIGSAEGTTAPQGNAWLIAKHHGKKLRAEPEDQPTSPERPKVPRKAPKPVVFRSRNGLNLAIWKAYHVTESSAHMLGINKNAARDVLTAQFLGAQNIAVVSTAHEDIAYKLLTVQSLTMGDKTCPTYTYVAAPDGATKAVVHWIKPDTPPSELMEDLQGKGYGILSARMLGGSETALVTVRGRKIPQHVKYMCSYPVLENRPSRRRVPRTRQFGVPPMHRAQSPARPPVLSEVLAVWRGSHDRGQDVFGALRKAAAVSKATPPAAAPGLEGGKDDITAAPECRPAVAEHQPAMAPEQQPAAAPELQPESATRNDDDTTWCEATQRQPGEGQATPAPPAAAATTAPGPTKVAVDIAVAPECQPEAAEHQPAAPLELLPEPVTRKDEQNTCCQRNQCQQTEGQAGPAPAAAEKYLGFEETIPGLKSLPTNIGIINSIMKLEKQIGSLREDVDECLPERRARKAPARGDASADNPIIRAPTFSPPQAPSTPYPTRPVAQPPSVEMAEPAYGRATPGGYN
ncbi:hypothetical protein HPB47_022367 [Ixodes persulcatus]|uniref:Uncharacterized protein n=1 Tax=Ixodes persulcatus TaxID=34615 RepID=A0AC60QBT1_IXOPE|nr:hypothetical protein HPB47_022367 [Ixodes persulcatus]